MFGNEEGADRGRWSSRPRVGTWVDRLDRLANGASRTALVLMLVLILVQVFTRYILSDPMGGVISATELYLMPIVVFGSLSYLEMHDGHVRVGILFDALPARLRSSIDIVLRLIAAAFFGLIAYGTTLEVLKAWEFGYRTSGGIDAPLVTTLVIAPLGSLLMVLRLLINAAGDVQRVMRGVTEG